MHDVLLTCGMALQLRELRPGDPRTISSEFGQIGWRKPESIFERYLSEQSSGERIVIVAEAGGVFAGYLTVKLKSDYVRFRINNIPEIKDLNVLPKFRRQGIATTLIGKAEHTCTASFDRIGIGFGLTPEYGAAQILYVSLGYMPDGHGVAYQGQNQKHRTQIRLDDDLVLFLVKCLETSDS